MSTRKSISKDDENKVLIKSKRRCCLCFGVDDDLREKDGQIAHLDKNNANSKFENLAFMCFNHHNKFDSTSSQSKNYTKKEVKYYRDKLYEYYDGIDISKSSSIDYTTFLNDVIKLTSRNREMKNDKLIIEVDNIDFIDPFPIKLEMWNESDLEIIINKIHIKGSVLLVIVKTFFKIFCSKKNCTPKKPIDFTNNWLFSSYCYATFKSLYLWM